MCSISIRSLKIPWYFASLSRASTESWNSTSVAPLGLIFSFLIRWPLSSFLIFLRSIEAFSTSSPVRVVSLFQTTNSSGSSDATADSLARISATDIAPDSRSFCSRCAAIFGLASNRGPRILGFANPARRAAFTSSFFVVSR